MVEEVERQKPQRLFVDLRNNGGGGSRVLEPIVDWLASHPVLNHPSRCFVAIGRRTFSSAMLNTVHFRERTAATILGEPTGGKPNAYGEVKMVRLPRSGIGVWFSTNYFSSVEGNPPSVDPDRLVETSAEDYFAGRDPVLAAALAVEPAGTAWADVGPDERLEGVWHGVFEAPASARDALPGGVLDFKLAVLRTDDGGFEAAIETVLHPEPIADASYREDQRVLTGRIALPGHPDGVPVTFTFGERTVRASADTERFAIAGSGLQMRRLDPRRLLVRGAFERAAQDPAQVERARASADALLAQWRATPARSTAWRGACSPRRSTATDSTASHCGRRGAPTS